MGTHTCTQTLPTTSLPRPRPSLPVPKHCWFFTIPGPLHLLFFQPGMPVLFLPTWQFSAIPEDSLSTQAPSLPRHSLPS